MISYFTVAGQICTKCKSDLPDNLLPLLTTHCTNNVNINVHFIYKSKTYALRGTTMYQHYEFQLEFSFSYKNIFHCDKKVSVNQGAI